MRSRTLILASYAISFLQTRARIDAGREPASCDAMKCGSGGLLALAVDLALCAMAAGGFDLDAPRLHLFGNLTLQVNGEQTVHQTRRGDLHVVGQLEAPRE